MTDIPDRELPKIRKALERIAEGVERYAFADPLTVLHEALQGGEMADQEASPQPLIPRQEPQGPIASNGFLHLYRHPDPRYHVVLRPDALAIGGYAATIEEA